jgi:hypothetical protein
VAGTQNASTDSTSEPADMSRALARFLRSYPAFAKTGVLDVVRATDYARLDEQGHTYLDYTGGGLYAESQLRQHQELLIGAVFGNPHSHNQAASAMSQRIEATRVQVLEFFDAEPEEYEVVFTPNATWALRLVGEPYPFGPDGHYLLTSDSHNSVNGISRQPDEGAMKVGMQVPNLARSGHLARAREHGPHGRSDSHAPVDNARQRGQRLSEDAAPGDTDERGMQPACRSTRDGALCPPMHSTDEAGHPTVRGCACHE